MSQNAAAETVKRPVARKDMTKFQWTLKEIGRNKTAYFMIAPFMILFFIFTVFPVLLSIILSFTQFNMLELPVPVFRPSTSLSMRLARSTVSETVGRNSGTSPFRP